MSADVLVLGAGPAGCVLATVLARGGHRVLLVDAPPPPADHAAYLGGPADHAPHLGGPADHALYVGGPAVTGLAELEIALPGRAADTVELRLGPGSRRPVAGTGGVVVDADALHAALRAAALAAGAELLIGTGTRTGGDDAGHRIRIDGPDGPTHRSARHLVVATGAADAAGLTCAARISGLPAGEDAVLLAVAAPDAERRVPVSIWVLPAGDGTGTLGVSCPVPDGPVGPDALLATATATLAGLDPRYAGLSRRGPVVSGGIHTGFSPDRLAAADGLLIGAAAGLANPFTGESLGHAVHSARLAAGAIGAHPDDPDAARRDYARGAAARFVGHFETARHAARRHHLTWRVLSAAADSDQPFFAKARRAILLPEGIAGVGVGTAGPLDADTPLTAPFLFACDEVVVRTVRTEWPFLAQLAASGDTLGARRLRPALLFLAGLLASAPVPAIRRATTAAGVELAMLGALAFLWPPSGRRGGRGVDWALTATVLSGDFLLAQASRLIAESAPEVSWAFADWLADLTRLRAGRPDSALDVYASLFEFPARIGAFLGDGPDATVRAVREYGHHCGRVFLHAEDVLALRGERTRLDTTLAAMLDGRFTAIPQRIDGRPVTVGALAADPGLRAAALAGATGAGRAAAARAATAADAVTAPAARRLLAHTLAAIAEPIGPADSGAPWFS